MQAAAAQRTPPMDSFVHTAIKIPEMVINPPAKVNIRDEKWTSLSYCLPPILSTVPAASVPSAHNPPGS